MLPLMVLMAVAASARAAGAFASIGSLDSWSAALGIGTAAMLLLTASAHFTQPRRDALIDMVLPVLGPAPLWVTITGVVEIFGAAGLLVPATRTVAGVGVAALLVVLFPANVRAARHGIGITSVPLPARALMQTAFVAACLTAAAGPTG